MIREYKTLREWTKHKRVSWHAAADRIELFLDVLAKCRVGETVKLDRAKATRAIEYCRWRAAGGIHELDTEATMCDAEWEMLEFLRSHNQCIDWFMTGNPTGMIAKLAMGTSSQERPHLSVV
jgi:hypothetical protein